MQKRAVPFILFGIVGIIVLLHFLLHPVRVLDMDTSIFYMDEKITLAAYFSQVVAFVAGFWIFAVLLPKLKAFIDRVMWAGVGLFYLILSFDEYFEVHESVNTAVKAALDTETLFGKLAHLSWIFPLILIIGVIYLLFFTAVVRERTREVRTWMIAGMVAYAFVLVFEILGSAAYGQSIYLTYVGIEEGLEMAGTVSFFMAILAKTSLLNPKKV